MFKHSERTVLQIMDVQKRKELQITAEKVRRCILEGVFHAKSGHPGGSLSSAEIFTYLYFQEMRIDPQNPRSPDRDRFVLSKGHCAPGWYGALAQRGYFDVSELQKLRHIGAMLQGHPDMKGTPGVDMSTGSLGQGISAAVGMAMAGKMDKASYRVYTLLGDGEIEEGQVWEAAMFAAHQKLGRLIAIIDNNELQIDGCIHDVCDPGDLGEKFAAFGWRVARVDGHDVSALVDMLSALKAEAVDTAAPVAVIAKTVKGKGVSFMENEAGWHGKAPKPEELETALAELAAAAE